MKPLANFIGAALVGAFALLAAPTAQAQVGVNINIGAPAWGPQVPQGTQYYYIPEIDGYYDLYTQQYIVFQDGYWVPLPQLYGYDPYQFHPVIVDYRGAQPWLRVDYYRQRYAYQPYRNYGPSRGYYNGGYGYGSSYGRSRNDNRGYDNRGYGNNGGYSRPREDSRPQSPGNYGGGRTNQPQQGFPQQNQPNPGQQTPGGFGHGNSDPTRDSQGPQRGNQGPQGGGRNDGGGRGGNNGGGGNGGHGGGGGRGRG